MAGRQKTWVRGLVVIGCLVTYFTVLCVASQKLWRGVMFGGSDIKLIVLWVSLWWPHSVFEW